MKQLQPTEVDDWSTHLRHAFEIVARRKSVEETMTIIVQSVKAAHRCAQGISQMLLSNSRGSTSIKFHTSCVRIANCLKPTRLRKETRNALDDVARHTFAKRDVNTESISDFLLGCHKVVEQRVQDKNSAEILKYLGLANDSRFGQLEDKKRGPPSLPIVTWYESLTMKLRLEVESKLRQLTEERQLQLAAHDVFHALGSLKSDQDWPDAVSAAKDLLVAYVQEVAGIWKRAGLNVGRSTNVYEPANLGPFPNFVERVLLSQLDAKCNVFDRPNEDQVWDAYEALPEDFQEAASAFAQPASRFITDRLLRHALKAFSKKVE